MKGKASGGLLLMVAGVWVLSQVLLGHALQRLGVAGGSSSGSGGDILNDPLPPVPDKGYSNVPHDAHGNPL